MLLDLGFPKKVSKSHSSLTFLANVVIQVMFLMLNEFANVFPQWFNLEVFG